MLIIKVEESLKAFAVLRLKPRLLCYCSTVQYIHQSPTHIIINITINISSIIFSISRQFVCSQDSLIVHFIDKER